jgi:hypothetical protein
MANAKMLSFPYFIGLIPIGGPNIPAKLTKISWEFSPLFDRRSWSHKGLIGRLVMRPKPTDDDAIQFQVTMHRRPTDAVFRLVDHHVVTVAPSKEKTESSPLPLIGWKASATWVRSMWRFRKAMCI